MPARVDVSRCKRPHLGAQKQQSGEPTVRVGALLRRKRQDIGWTLKYTAARIGLTPEHLLAIERGEPIPKSQYNRINKIYSRTWQKLTAGMARSTPPSRFQ